MRFHFLDGFVDSWFKTAADGSRIFFPFGVLGRGYSVPFPEDEERIKEHGKVLIIGLAIAGFLLILFQEQLPIVICLSAVFVFGIAVTFYLKHGLEPSNERLSYKENFQKQAFIYPVWFIWGGMIICAAFVALGLLILIFQPQEWPMAIGGIVFFGACSAVYIRMIIVRGRSTEA